MKIRQIIRRMKATWAELDYAQRRLFEIQTGIGVGGSGKSPRIARRRDELEALYMNSN
jgi:hypothetical protein